MLTFPEISYYVELVVWYLKILVALSVVVIGFVIRRKWRLAVEREAEIRRLMILAADEAARAELEDETVGYYDFDGEPMSRDVFGGGKVKVDKGGLEFCSKVGVKDEVGAGGIMVYQCAVCLRPTTTRCACCKSARYCSAKCQIFHWRKVHKDECHPPGTMNQSSDPDSYSCIKVVNQEKDKTISVPVAPDDRSLKQCHTQPKGNVTRSVDHTEHIPGRADDKENLQGVKTSTSTASFTSFTSVTSDSSFSGFSDSSDEASATASRSLNDREKANERQHRDISNQAIAKRSGEHKPCDVRNITADLSNVNLQESILNRSDSQRVLYGTISSNPSGASDFWNGTLDYRWSEPVKAKSDATKDDFPDIGASLRQTSYSFRKTENKFQLDGSALRMNDPDMFKKMDIDSSEVEKSNQSSSILSKPSRSLNFSVSNVSVNRAVSYSSSAAIIPPHSGSSKGETRNVSNSRLSSSRPPNSASSIAKPRCSFSNKDETGQIVRGVNACQASSASYSQNASQSSLFADKLGRLINSNRTEQPLKSAMAASNPSLSSGTHSSVSLEKNTPYSDVKTDVVKSNNNAATSNVSYSVKAVNCLKPSTWKAVEHFKASRSSRECGTDERHDNKGLFSFELFKSLYGWNKFELHPCGLVNCGNSCYANAVLQCLLFTPPLTAYLLQGLHSKDCTKRDWCFTCEFENLILKAKDGHSPISPIGIISHLTNIGSHLCNGREEDAHEFLRYVVDTMQSVCIKGAANKVVSIINEETTLVGLTFGGYLQSKIRCMKCGNKSERSERMMDLSVEIEGSIQSLEGALTRFTRSETLDAENKYNCPRCKSYQKAIKKLSVLEAPNILTIALKRFQVGKYGKLNKWVDFPEVLDMSSYMSRKSNDKAPVYKLYGVIVHLDNMNATFSGHYVCYVKNIQNKWFKIDDCVVKAVDFGKVKEQAAYMVLYARCLPKAPKSLRENFSSKTTMPLARPSIILDHVTSSETYGKKHYEKFETDSYGDNKSLFSSGSDEYSCSTDSNSARESNSADDLSDLIFGDSGRGLGYSWTSSDSSSPSVSPFWS